MDPNELKILLNEFKSGAIGEDEALERLRHLPFEDIGDAWWTITGACARGSRR